MFLHSKKSMHCDIKEANVMISGDTDWLNPSHGRCFSHRLCSSFGSGSDCAWFAHAVDAAIVIMVVVCACCCCRRNHNGLNRES